MSAFLQISLNQYPQWDYSPKAVSKFCGNWQRHRQCVSNDCYWIPLFPNWVHCWINHQAAYEGDCIRKIPLLTWANSMLAAQSYPTYSNTNANIQDSQGRQMFAFSTLWVGYHSAAEINDGNVIFKLKMIENFNMKNQQTNYYVTLSVRKFGKPSNDSSSMLEISLPDKSSCSKFIAFLNNDFVNFRILFIFKCKSFKLVAFSNVSGSRDFIFAELSVAASNWGNVSKIVVGKFFRFEAWVISKRDTNSMCEWSIGAMLNSSLAGKSIATPMKQYDGNVWSHFTSRVTAWWKITTITNNLTLEIKVKKMND